MGEGEGEGDGHGKFERTSTVHSPRGDEGIAENGLMSGQERAELIRALSFRLVELRRQAGMRQEDVAEAMGLDARLKSLVSRFEHGAVGNATLLSVADYLRAVRAGFRDVKPVLDRYTSVPIPEPMRHIAEAAPKPRARVTARIQQALTWTGNRPALPGPVMDERSAEELMRIRRRAGYWSLRQGLECYMHHALTAMEVPPAHWLRRRMARYGRRVFGMLFFTRGPKETHRPERFERLHMSADKQQLSLKLAEVMDTAVMRLFDEMQRERDLDWLPEPAEAVEIVSLKPSRRVVTDAQMCRAEWQTAWGRYANATAEVDRRGHEGAEKVLASACPDPRLLQHYRVALIWATRIGADTASGSPQRERALKMFREWRFPPQLDRGLLDRMLATVLEVWDSARPSLPPAPGPTP